MGRRVLAAIGAVALVLTAVVVRGLIDGGDGDGAEGGDGDRALVVVCDTDLSRYCESAFPGAEIRVEDSAMTSEMVLRDRVNDVDAWVTTHVWIELTRNRAKEAPDPATLGEPRALAAAEVTLAATAPRVEAIRALCEATSAWRCLGDHAGQPWAGLGGETSWGLVRTGLPDADTAVGLAVLASVAAGYFGDLEFTANDFLSTPEGDFRTWLAGLADRSGTGERDLLTTLVRRQGQYDAGGILRHEADRRRELETLATEPRVPVVAAVVPIGDADEPSADDLSVSLVADGWTAPGAEPPVDLLRPGVMGALHQLWKDVVR